jgi:phthalate 4,5-dioxygenase oxygenase subunit
MLSADDNEILCRVGPGTLMGDLMRQYWTPAIRSDEMLAPNSPPVRIRLLGEDLIGFRASSGNVGLIQDKCPHRGGSLFFGRNEEEGLRCVYHGWKYDLSGQCVDMPSEPAGSKFWAKVKAKAYPCIERNGIIWTYMGPRADPPPLPDLEANMLEGSYDISILLRGCNWMQGLEGELDTVHQAFLHHGAVSVEDVKPGTWNYYNFKNREADFLVLDTPWGTSGAARRPAEEDSYYWRIAHMCLPFFPKNATGVLENRISFQAYVPIDDDHTLEWAVVAVAPAADGKPPESAQQQIGQGGRAVLSNTSGWLGRFNSPSTWDNDYMIDREAQSAWKSYTGIPGIREQDMALTDSMGVINDRTQEHLATTDLMIIRTRRRLLAAARALRESGTVPPGVDEPWVYRQRSGGIVMPRNLDWFEDTKELRERFVPCGDPTSVKL